MQFNKCYNEKISIYRNHSKSCYDWMHPERVREKEGSSDKKVLTENVKLATCNINVGGIRFTKSKTAERMVSHFLATLSSLWPVPKLIISAPRMEALSIALQSFYRS